MGKVLIANFDLFWKHELTDPCRCGPAGTNQPLVNWPNLAPASKNGQNPRDTPHLAITEQTTAGSAVSSHCRSSAFPFPLLFHLLAGYLALTQRAQGPWGMGARAFPVTRDGPTHNSLFASCTPYRKFLPSSPLAAAFRHSGRVSVRATAAPCTRDVYNHCLANLVLAVRPQLSLARRPVP